MSNRVILFFLIGFVFSIKTIKGSETENQPAITQEHVLGFVKQKEEKKASKLTQFGVDTVEKAKEIGLGTLNGTFGLAQHILQMGKDGFGYIKDMAFHGIDSTRTLNIAIARYRDLFGGSFAHVKGKQKELNAPPMGADGIFKTAYWGHVSESAPPAQVRLSYDLCDQEKEFISQRDQHITKRLPEVFKDPAIQKSVEKKCSPRIAVCASGGGFRAMMATAGLIKGLEQTGIIDTVMFMSVLSGSTWVTIPRSLGKSIDALTDGYMKYAKLPFTSNPAKIKQVMRDYPQMRPQAEPTDYCKFPEMKTIENNWLRKFYFDLPFDAMDLYGPLIAHMVLAPFDDPEIIKNYPLENTIALEQTRQRVLFSQAQITLANNDYGTFPLPIATAVAPVKGFFDARKQKLSKSKLQWFEFSPYEVGTPGGFIPTYAMGRRFKKMYENSGSFWSKVPFFGDKGSFKGICSVENTPEYPLGNLLAIWGSAFAFSPKDLVRILGFDFLLPDANSLSPATLFKKLIGFAVSAFAPITSLFGSFRVFPATIHNFLKDVPELGQKDPTLLFVDAGIDCNLPFIPLLRPERAVDIIITLDAGMPVFVKDKKGNYHIEALEIAAQLAQNKGFKFPQIVGSPEYQKAITINDASRAENPIIVFKGYDGAPTIIFIPFVDNKESDSTQFTVSKCYEDDCNTFNFRYSELNVKGVIDHVRATVVNNFDTIQKAVIDCANTKLLQAENNNIQIV